MGHILQAQHLYTLFHSPMNLRARNPFFRGGNFDTERQGNLPKGHTASRRLGWGFNPLVPGSTDRVLFVKHTTLTPDREPLLLLRPLFGTLEFFLIVQFTVHMPPPQRNPYSLQMSLGYCTPSWTTSWNYLVYLVTVLPTPALKGYSENQLANRRASDIWKAPSKHVLFQ